MTNRIGTTAAFTLYRSQMSSLQKKINDLSYQSVTGERYSSYDRYGLTAYRLVTLENEQKIVDQYLENNEITKVNLETMESAVDSIRSILLEFQSSLTAFYANDLQNMDTQEGITQIANLQEAAYEAMSQVAYFLNSQVDGVYVFGGGENTKPPVDFPFKSLEEFQAYYDGNTLTYPSDIRALLSNIETSDDVTGGLTFKQNMVKADTSLRRPLHFQVTKNGDGTTTRTLTAAAGSFSGLAAGDTLTIAGTGSNNGTFQIASVSADGSTVTFADGAAISEEVVDAADAAANVTITTPAGNIDMTTATSSAYAFEMQTNEDGTQSAVLKGGPDAFSNLQAGDEIRIIGMGANDGVYYVKSVSLDGTKITFGDGVTVTPEIINADKVNLDDIVIEQKDVTGTIEAMDDNGYSLADWTIPSTALTLDEANQTLTASHMHYFENITAGQSIEIDGKTVYVKNVEFDEATDTAKITLSTDTPLTAADIPAGDVKFSSLSDVHGFVSDVIKGSEALTGDIFFNAAKNQMTANVAGAFEGVQAGDTIILKGADGNNGVYYVKDVGADGRTITFSDETKLNVDGKIENGTGVSLGLTYPVGSTLAIDKVSASYNGSYTILGVSKDGNSLTVKTEKFTKDGVSFAATGAQSVKTSSYYQGSNLESTVRVGTQTEIKMDIDASKGAFATIFTALGQIAQGNLIDLRAEEQTLDAIDENRVETRVRSALDLITEALSSYRTADSYSNITNIQYALVSKTSRLQNTTQAQTNLAASLETYIGNIKRVDQTEAVTMLLEEKKNLSASYQVFSTINNLSLLNYL